jgi:hypothetical protein
MMHIEIAINTRVSNDPLSMTGNEPKNRIREGVHIFVVPRCVVFNAKGAKKDVASTANQKHAKKTVTTLWLQ